jgi:hypothetical protein
VRQPLDVTRSTDDLDLPALDLYTGSGGPTSSRHRLFTCQRADTSNFRSDCSSRPSCFQPFHSRLGRRILSPRFILSTRCSEDFFVSSRHRHRVLAADSRTPSIDHFALAARVEGQAGPRYTTESYIGFDPGNLLCFQESNWRRRVSIRCCDSKHRSRLVSSGRSLTTDAGDYAIPKPRCQGG